VPPAGSRERFHYGEGVLWRPWATKLNGQAIGTHQHHQLSQKPRRHLQHSGRRADGAAGTLFLQGTDGSVLGGDKVLASSAGQYHRC